MGFWQLVPEALATDAFGRLWILSAPVPWEGLVDSYCHQEPISSHHHGGISVPTRNHRGITDVQTPAGFCENLGMWTHDPSGPARLGIVSVHFLLRYHNIADCVIY